MIATRLTEESAVPMMRLVVAATIALLCSHPVAAQESHASEASVRQVLEATHAENLLTSMDAQIEANLRAGIQRELAGQPLNEKQRAIMADMEDKLVALMHEELDWKRLEPQFIQLYRDTFTQHEIDGMLAFYRSPTGKAVVAKLPVVMEKMTGYTQGMVQDMVPRLLQLQKDAITQLKAAASPPAEVAPPTAAPAKP
jgi:hypothetical protein